MVRENNRKEFADIRFKKSERGFPIGEWTDYYGEGCSIQDSSIATEACVWLGVGEPSIKRWDPGTPQPWKDVKLDEGVLIASRMHLTLPMATALRDALDRFIKTGSVAP